MTRLTYIEKLREWNASPIWQEFTDRILNRYKNSRMDEILDVGCGIGEFVHKAQKFFPKSKVFGTDTYLFALHEAEKLKPYMIY